MQVPPDPDRRTGRLIVLSAPSGAGKTSLVRALLERDPNLRVSISYTTRPPRSGEVHGEDYVFVSRPRFESMIAFSFARTTATRSASARCEECFKRKGVMARSPWSNSAAENFRCETT